MADVKYVTLDNLKRYDALVKQYVDDKTASTIKTVTFDPETGTMRFYRMAPPIPSGAVPTYEFNISSSAEVDKILELIGDIPEEGGEPVADTIVEYIDMKSMSQEDKDKLNSITVATEQQIRGLFE